MAEIVFNTEDIIYEIIHHIKDPIERWNSSQICQVTKKTYKKYYTKHPLAEILDEKTICGQSLLETRHQLILFNKNSVRHTLINCFLGFPHIPLYDDGQLTQIKINIAKLNDIYGFNIQLLYNDRSQPYINTSILHAHIIQKFPDFVNILQKYIQDSNDIRIYMM